MKIFGTDIGSILYYIHNSMVITICGLNNETFRVYLLDILLSKSNSEVAIDATASNKYNRAYIST